MAKALPVSARLAGYRSFAPEQLEVMLDGERLLPTAHQQVVANGPAATWQSPRRDGRPG